jgi:N-acetylmuramoyl-L-alanine amidase
VLQTVVLDPGHGGSDPGAIGVGGLREKDVTLRLALALRPKLEARGFSVVMTRNGDRRSLARGAHRDRRGPRAATCSCRCTRTPRRAAR